MKGSCVQYVVKFVILNEMEIYITITEVGSLHIGGYQARYIMPILPLALMCVSSERLKSKENKNRNMNIAITSGIFIFIGILQAIVV